MKAFLADYYLWIQSVHIIAIIAWMAGMMYLPRLFVYHMDANPGGEADENFRAMERRLLKGIMNPSIIAVWVFGILMIVANPAVFDTGWFRLKLILVIAISGIHGFYAANQRRFGAGERPRTARFWRIMNEAPFILLIIIVFLAVLKPF